MRYFFDSLPEYGFLQIFIIFVTNCWVTFYVYRSHKTHALFTFTNILGLGLPAQGFVLLTSEPDKLSPTYPESKLGTFLKIRDCEFSLESHASVILAMFYSAQRLRDGKHIPLITILSIAGSIFSISLALTKQLHQ